MLLRSKPRYIKCHYIDLTVIGTLLIIAIILFRHINYYHVPNPDVFQFILDGHYYISGHLPPNIHAPPANPVLLTFISKFLNTDLPEIHAAITINILACLIACFLIWKIGQTYLDNIAGLILFFLVISNPVFYYVSLNTTSEVWFATNLALILYLRLQRKYFLAYILAGLGFFIRYESIIFIPIFAAVDLIAKLDWRQVIKWAVIGSLPVIFWLIVISRQNHSGTLAGNTFLTEIKNRTYMLPMMKMVEDYPGQILFNSPIDYQHSRYLIYASTIIGIILFIIYVPRKSEVIILTLITLSYVGIHMSFPASDPRYLFPILWTIYLYNLWPLLIWPLFKHRLHLKNPPINFLYAFILIPYVYLIAHNVVEISPYLKTMNKTGLENRLVANWIMAHYSQKKAVVVTLEPWITEYYAHTPQILFLNPSNFSPICEDINCIIDQLPSEFLGQDLLVIRDSYTDSADKFNFNAINFGVKFFKTFKGFVPPPNYQLLTYLYKNQNWAMVYKYIPQNQPQHNTHTTKLP